jgi:hypothetical protein
MPIIYSTQAAVATVELNNYNTKAALKRTLFKGNHDANKWFNARVDMAV